MTESRGWQRGGISATSGRFGRRSLLRAGGVAGVGLAGAALIGCGDDDDEPTPVPTAPGGTATPGTTPAGTATPSGPGDSRQGGMLSLSAGATQDNFNPVTNPGEGMTLSAIHIYDRLMSPRPDDRVYVLEAAEEVELVDDTTVVFTLREGLVYQDRAPVDGRPVLADDVVQMQEYILQEAGAINTAFQQFSLASMEAPDDRTVIFHLQRPNAYLFSGTQLGFPPNHCIVPSELILGDLNQTEPVGSGPYQLASHQMGVRYSYERNPTYRGAADGLPYIDVRDRIVMTDGSALEAAFRSEQNHVWIPPAEIADRLVNDLSDRIDVQEFTALEPFVWNMSRASDAFDDIRVREGIYRAFDAEEIITLVADGRAVPVPGKVSAALTDYQLDESETAEYTRHDPEEARQLLDAAGFDFDRVYEFTTLLNPVNDSALQVLYEQMRRIGIEGTFKVQPASEWLPNTAQTGDYDIGLVGFPAWDTPQQAMRLNHSEPGSINAWMGIRDPEIDVLIEESEVMLDRDENIDKVKEIQRALLENYAHLSYVWTAMNRELKWGYIRDWETNPANHPMYRVEAWIDR